MRTVDIIKRPIVMTEKAGLLKLESKVVFEVDPAANKAQIRNAVEQLFGVKVTNVNSLVQRGKPRRLGRSMNKRPNWKKAIVTLRQGDEIQFFDESQE